MQWAGSGVIFIICPPQSPPIVGCEATVPPWWLLGSCCSVWKQITELTSHLFWEPKTGAMLRRWLGSTTFGCDWTPQVPLQVSDSSDVQIDLIYQHSNSNLGISNDQHMWWNQYLSITFSSLCLYASLTNFFSCPHHSCSALQVLLCSLVTLQGTAGFMMAERCIIILQLETKILQAAMFSKSKYSSVATPLTPNNTSEKEPWAAKYTGEGGESPDLRLTNRGHGQSFQLCPGSWLV